MNGEHHQNPIFSVIAGAGSGLFAYVQSNGFLIENALEFIKILIFGFIGGMVGYLGKIVAEKWHKYLKEKSKDICK